MKSEGRREAQLHGFSRIAGYGTDWRWGGVPSDQTQESFKPLKSPTSKLKSPAAPALPSQSPICHLRCSSPTLPAFRPVDRTTGAVKTAQANCRPAWP